VPTEGLPQVYPVGAAGRDPAPARAMLQLAAAMRRRAAILARETARPRLN